MVRVVEEARAAHAAGEVRTCLCVSVRRAFRTRALTLSPCPRHAYSYSLLPPDRIYLASHRVVRPSTARRARVAIIPRARYAHLLLAPSAPCRTQRRACALQLDYFYHPCRRRRINPIPILIRVSEERPTLPAHVTSALRDA